MGVGYECDKASDDDMSILYHNFWSCRHETRTKCFGGLNKIQPIGLKKKTPYCPEYTVCTASTISLCTRVKTIIRRSK